jgi:hypothetical protein
MDFLKQLRIIMVATDPVRVPCVFVNFVIPRPDKKYYPSLVGENPS